MLKGGVIMDVVTPEQARVAEDAGACAVMALERVPADIRRDGGVARMSDPAMIKGIQEAVTIPVMAKARIGHFAEAQVLQSLEVDYIDESEVLTPADERHHIDKLAFEVPFVCGATNLGEALRRIGEGAAMIRSKGEAGTGNVVEAVRHMREITSGIKRLAQLGPEELAAAAKEHHAPLEVVHEVAGNGRLPVPLFCAGGIATPADAALMMQLGAEGNFVGSGIFKSDDPERRAKAIVEATTHFNDPERVAAASIGLGGAMPGLEIAELAAADALCRTAVPELRIGVLAVQGGFEAHAGCSKSSGPWFARSGSRRIWIGLDGLVIPGGESTTISKGIEAGGACRADQGAPRGRRAGVRDLRGDDRLRRLAPGADRRDRGAQRLRPSAAELRGGFGDQGDRRGGAAGRLHPGAVGRPLRSRRGGARHLRGSSGGDPRRQRARLRLPPGADRRPRLHALFMAMTTTARRRARRLRLERSTS